MMCNFGHLNPDSAVHLFKSYYCSIMVQFYGNITVMDLDNFPHIGIIILEEYMPFHIIHIDGYSAI